MSMPTQPPGQTPGQTPGHSGVHLIRVEAARNMARFYDISLQTTLFGEVALLRRWGRIGTAGQQRVQTFAGLSGAVREQVRWERAKRRRGYTVRP